MRMSINNMFLKILNQIYNYFTDLLRMKVSKGAKIRNTQTLFQNCTNGSASLNKNVTRVHDEKYLTKTSQDPNSKYFSQEIK